MSDEQQILTETESTTNGRAIKTENGDGDRSDTELVIDESVVPSDLEPSKNSVKVESAGSSEEEVVVKMEDEEAKGSMRESRLTSIIDQLRCANKLKGYAQRSENLNFGLNEGEGGGGGRRCARDAAVSSPSHAPTPAPPPQPPPLPPVKTERLSPHDNRSSASRSRSVTPSTSSYPGTPPERGSPQAAASAQPPAPPAPRNYSDIMRSLAARYNTHHANDYFHRINGFGSIPEARPAPQTSPLRTEVPDAPLGGLFTRLARQQGGPPRLPAFPVMLDMSSTKTLLAIARVGRGGRQRRKRAGANTASGPEHSPLDLSAASESASKRARLSASPSTRSESDERDRTSGDDRSEARSDCLCAEARARLSAWSVDDVCDFVNSIDICAEYASNFREQRIDGAGLPLLTEDHLTGMLQMKLGPALKLRATLARRLELCATCQAANANNLANNTNSMMPRINGTVLKSEPRSNTTSPS